MTIKLTVLTLFFSTIAHASESKFSQDRAAILGMAGAFEVEFNFQETVALAKGYQLKKPYQSKARELVKVAEDTGKRITLQHLLLFRDSEGDMDVIKHWAQIWEYEDSKSLSFEGAKTWLPVIHSPEETKGTWTQLVTQIDDSPRYKAQGIWSHNGNNSTWTSRLSTRPLPRRDYTKRKDYDVIVAVNQHIITPNGWVHQQSNRKLVNREGQSQFLCIENGLNKYRRLSSPEDIAHFKPAETLWAESHHFWKDVRAAWLDIIERSEKPVHYVARIGTNQLMTQMGDLSKNEQATRSDIDQLIAQYLR